MSESCSLEVDRKRLKIREFSINAVLNRSLSSSTLPLTDVWAVEVVDKRRIPHLLSILPQLPTKLAHLKRIKGQLVLFADASDCLVASNLKRKITDKIGISNFVIVQVNSTKPKTVAQFIESKKYWPSSFYENKILERKLNNTFFDETELRLYGGLFMRAEEVNGGLLFDPRTKQIVVKAMSALPDRSLQHPVMRLIDTLSKLQLDVTSNVETSSKVDADVQYLANGFDIILSSEPCTMCAMALVHARIGRVFFGRVNLHKGALVSRWRLQEEPSINHHYEIGELSVHPAFRIREFGFDNEEAVETWNYSDILEIASRVQCCAKRLKKSDHSCLIGVAIERSALYVATIVGGNAFVSLDPPIANSNNCASLSDYTLNKCQKFNVSIIISSKALQQLPEIYDEPVEESLPRAKRLFFVKLCNLNVSAEIEKFWNLTNGSDKILYAIQTSGSTGEPKLVLVPIRAIMPNIVDFSLRFKLTESARILFSTSIFFDPSIVEMFLAIYCGAELIIIPADFTATSILLEKAIISCRPLAFAQFTPAVLQRFRLEFLRTLFGSQAPISNILVGGEVFPLNLVISTRATDCSARIFNVYGVTELSCWASCGELNFSNVGDNASNICKSLVDIGKPLLNTEVRVNLSDQSLVIGGSRQCFVNFQFCDVKNGSWIPTEDLAVEKFDEVTCEKKIYVRGRKKKPNGILPFCAEIEEIFLENFPEIIFAKLIFVDNCRMLFVNFVDSTSSFKANVEEFLRNETKIPKRLRPTRVFYDIPMKNVVTNNGKVDEEKLANFATETMQNCFINESKNAWQLLCRMYPNLNCFQFSEELLQSSLRCIGLGSLEITELAFLIEQVSEDSGKHSSTELIQVLLDEEQTKLKNLLEIVEKLLSNNKPHLNIARNVQTFYNCEEISLKLKLTKFEVKEAWVKNLGKCVDASPVLLEINEEHESRSLVYVGSHAGIFRCFDLFSGEVLLQFDDEFSAAIETKCAVGERYIVFGTLSGKIFIFERNSHKFCDFLQTAAEIRASPVIFRFHRDSLPPREMIFCGSYDGFLYSFEMDEESKKIRNSSLISFDVSATRNEFGLIRAAPLICPISVTSTDMSAVSVIVATLGGFIIAFEMLSSRRRWYCKLDGPVFADLRMLPITQELSEMTIFIVVTVRGTITLFNSHKGEKICELCLNSNIFDAPTLCSVKTVNGVMNQMLLSHNKKTFIVQIIYSTTDCLSLNLCKILNFETANDNFSVVRSPLIIGDYTFLLTTTGILIRFSSILFQFLSQFAGNNSSDNDLWYEKIIELNEATFGSPIIKVLTPPIGTKPCYRVLVGSRADLVHCFHVS